MSPLSERDFQRQVTELAELYGWEWMHPRAGRTADSWRTPMSGTMAQGWPDLVLVKPPRLLFIEIKAEAGKTTLAQERVLAVLRGLEEWSDVEVYVWRPSDWEAVEATLTRRAVAA